MRIAMMVRGYIAAPRPKDMLYAPIDLAIQIAEGLQQRGHEVDFYGPTGSQLSVTTQTCNLRPLVENQESFQKFLKETEKLTHYVPYLWDAYLAGEMFKRAKAGYYDVLHFHHPEIALQLAQMYPKMPVVYTLHDPVYPWYREAFELYHSPNQHFVSISDNQRRDAPDLSYVATVPNGIDVSAYPFSESHEDYLLFVGRIAPEKGVKEAIQIANETNHRLLIIGPLYDDHRGYFEQYVKPFLNDRILYLGYIEKESISPYYQKAKAFLMPIQWEEPFGLTMIEAMASGTPVIALKRGSVPEVVVHGKTGFIVDSIGDMIKAVEKVNTIDRQDCHNHVASNFCIGKMVAGYEAAFKKVLKSHKTSLLPTARRITQAIKQSTRRN